VSGWKSITRSCSALFLCLLALSVSLAVSGCGDSSGTPRGAFVGRAGAYDYSPSAIQTGTQLQIWWCGIGKNPEDLSQRSDTILYTSIDLTTGVRTEPVVVLAETRGAWDASFLCNPRVIAGAFTNPLGDGVTYTYAMYYVATNVPQGLDNSIGVAFSNDGIHWKKYKDPVIVQDVAGFYGVGQPVAYNLDGKSNLVLLYEESTPNTSHKQARTADGIHFTLVGEVTRNGLDPNNPSPTWGDAGYDQKTHTWYAAFNLPTRDKDTVGGALERGQYGIQLFRIPDSALIDGSQPWELVKTFDTNSTGYESIFLAALLKDRFGNLNVGAFPVIQIYPSFSNPGTHWNDTPDELGLASNEIHWDIGSVTWSPAEVRLALKRYSNGDSYNSTTGYLDPAAHYLAHATLGHLWEGMHGAATTPFFNCKNSSRDYFVSTDPACGGSYRVGVEGYGYATPVAGQNLAPLYSCSSARMGHFASKDAQCEGSGAGTLLGYILP
jgi:hypothetical protein